MIMLKKRTAACSIMRNFSSFLFLLEQDGENDIKAGLVAGCRTALIGNGCYKQDVKVDSLLDFVKNVLLKR